MSESPAGGAQPEGLAVLEVLERVVGVAQCRIVGSLAGEHGDRDPWGVLSFPWVKGLNPHDLGVFL